jgi:hypothetical protein
MIRELPATALDRFQVIELFLKTFGVSTCELLVAT